MRYKIISTVMVAVLLAGLFPYNAQALYESDSLNNVVPNDFLIRTDSALLDLSSPDISYNPDALRVMIKGYGKIDSLNGVYVSHYLPTAEGYIAFGTTLNSNLPLLEAQGLEVRRDVRLEFDQVRDASRLGAILGSESVSKDHGLTGKGVKVAIVDTGTDFSNPDLSHAIARDVNGKPIMLDADGQGIVITKTKFKANITPKGNLLNSTLDQFVGTDVKEDTDEEANGDEDEDQFISNVFYTDEGVFLNLERDGNGTRFEVYNSIYPLISPLILNATSNKNWKIGESNRDFIRSMSAEYKMGFMLQVQFHLGRAGLIIVPVLLVDSEKPGVYDTIIADMSSSWADFNKFELNGKDEDAEFDYSFTDEKRIKLGNGNELLTYDADKDGSVDLSAGMVGAHVLDVWGVINEDEAEIDNYLGVVNGTLLKPLDPDGNYFGVLYDFLGHGTGSAGSVASRGHETYDVYRNSTNYRLKGVAPDAKIIPIKALWYGDVAYGWFWASGFEQDGEGNWKYTGNHRADVVNNSWGVSMFPVLDYGPGYDLLSVLSSLLSVPGAVDGKFPGVLMMNSAGNTGFGYGTVGPPATSPFALTVGATTNNVYVGYEFTRNEPRFGNSTEHYDDIAGFSSRGPSIFGDVKPEIMSIGAYAFVPMPPNTKHIENSTGPFGLFGGTSMASPLTAGTAALVIEALKSEDVEFNPFLVKSILVSSADDLGSDTFTQGAGRVNVDRAVDYVKGVNGTFIVYTNDSYSKFAGLLNNTLATYKILGFGNVTEVAEEVAEEEVIKGNETMAVSYGNYSLAFPDKELPDAKWYPGFVNKGESREASFTVVNNSDESVSVDIKPSTLKLIEKQSFNGTTEVRMKDPKLNGNETGYIPNYVDLSEKLKIPRDAELMVVKVNFPFESFLNETEQVYASSLKIASLYFYDWQDKDSDGEVAYDELSMVNRGGAWGTVQEVTVRDPTSRIKHTPLVGVYPVPTIFSYWNGNTNENSTSMNYTLTVSFYKKGPWDDLSFDQEKLDVSSHSQRVFRAVLTVPEDAMPGVYQGYVTVSSEEQQVNIPVSYAVPVSVNNKDVPVVISGSPKEDLLYDNAAVMGSFDMLSRYNAGDWRFYYFNVTDPSVNAMNMRISWRNNWTSINAMVVNPQGKIVASSVPAGVFKVFIGWASNDWLGSTRFSEGGGFYPAANEGPYSSVLYVPVNSTGIYSLMLHNTLFHGKELAEPFTIETKFTTLLPDTEPPVLSVEVPKYVKGAFEIPVNTVEENIQEVTYSLDGAEPVAIGTNATIAFDASNMAEGFHRLNIVASDTVGHRIYRDFFFAVDNTAPDVRIRTPPPDMIVSGELDVNVDVSDPTLKTFSITLPNGTSVSDVKNLTIDTVGLEDGEHKILVAAEDSAGNAAEQSVIVKVDNTAPVVAITSPEDASSVSGIIEVKYDIKEENLKSVLLSVSGRSLEIGGSGSYGLNTTALFDGEYTLEIMAEDEAGNVGSSSVNIATANFGPVLQNAQMTGVGIGLAIGMAGIAVTVVGLVAYYKRRYVRRAERETEY